MAEAVDNAAFHAKPIGQLGSSLNVEDAYRIQTRSIARRIARGERRIGVKMGFTSKAKMIQMGVSDLIWGRLTDGMRVDDGGTIHMARYVHPRCEPEIAFLIGKEIAGPITMLEAQDAVAAIAPAIEIIDSRYEGFKFTWTDVVADNASSSGFVVGAWQDKVVDIANLGMVMRFDGAPVQIGSSAAILGQPFRALVDAARLVALEGERLMPGDIVLAGAATPAEALRPGLHVSLDVQNLGSVEFQVAR
ncbi:fumarylacetoacetate hydrolase family protein (plasmid) [Novosphingobium humi]|uniref:Fumarylacetoacetate hydrolase family protein n=2 Tax=Novosphingobium humi TaxID=2282397 RepID=A0ABY7U3R5_9SPHN|nr:fumarylacetoacetate hydrolase family protein [Novosphingobium humi]WCT80134.1 fumarylacetoacetate hydrolase family protein [Novosphingobium humi]